MKNLTMMLLGAAGLLASANAALAQDTTPATPAPAPADAAAAPPAPDWALAGTLDVQSDYRFRGISQSNRNPVPQGSLTLTGPDGFYVGSWSSMINWQLDGVNDNPGVEWDIYGGKHFDLGGTDLNVEAYEYAYPDARTFGGPAASFFEGIFTLSHTFGPLALDAVYAISPQFSGGTGTGNYVEGQGTFTINDWLTASVDLGHQWVQTAPSDYTHADVGVTGTWKMFSLDLRYFTTDLNKSNCAFYMSTVHACGPGFAATLTYNANLLP